MITTYISHLPADPNDAVLKQLLSDVRLVTGKDWYVMEYRLGLLRRRTGYELVVRLHGIEFQIINFYSSTSGTSINTCVPIEWIVGFLHGILCGDAGVKHDLADFSKQPPVTPG